MAKSAELPTNEAATLVNRGLAALFAWLKGLSNTAARADAPWLNLPIISTIFEFFLNKVEALAYKHAATGGSFIVIHFQTTMERDEYVNAFEALRIAQAKGDTGEERKAALERARRAADNLIAWNGVIRR